MMNMLTQNLEFSKIEAGDFVQGLSTGYQAEKPVHITSLTYAFRISKYLITQAQYFDVMKTNPSYFGGDRNPVENVTWFDAVEFCRRLTETSRAAGEIAESAFYRLPTEAEWEGACRPREKWMELHSQDTGDVTDLGPHWWDPKNEKLTEYAWFLENSGGATQAVGQLKNGPNDLFDMLGNVTEWCHDWFGFYSEGRATDPLGPEAGDRKVRRGGSWDSISERCRVTDRAAVAPDCRSALLGFRVVLVDSGTPPYSINYRVW